MERSWGRRRTQSPGAGLTFLSSCSSLSWAQLSAWVLHIPNLGLGSTGVESWCLFWRCLCLSRPCWGSSGAEGPLGAPGAPLGLHLGEFGSPGLGSAARPLHPLHQEPGAGHGFVPTGDTFRHLERPCCSVGPAEGHSAAPKAPVQPQSSESGL